MIIADVPHRLVKQLAESVTRAVATIPVSDVVAVVVIYHHMPPNSDPDPVEIYACTRQRREELLRLYPLPDGAVYVWSNLEFDSYVPGEVADRVLGPVWLELDAFAQCLYASADLDSPEFDDTLVSREALVNACRLLNDGGWDPSPPSQLAPDCVIYPAALGGVDPDTPDNLRAALADGQRRPLEAAGLLPI